MGVKHPQITCFCVSIGAMTSLNFVRFLETALTAFDGTGGYINYNVYEITNLTNEIVMRGRAYVDRIYSLMKVI